MESKPGKPILSRLSLFMLAALVPGCGGGGGGGSYSAPPPPPPPANTVMVGSTGAYMDQNIFSPVTLTVSAGTTVTWSWATSGHTVDSGTSCTSDGGFSSGGVQSAGFTMTHQFMTPGTYHYYCTTHCGLGMTGTIVVQ
jgi:plastocyanin